MLIPPPLSGVPIVNTSGHMADHFRIFALRVSELGVFIGSGSPEGVISAKQTQLYMDESGTPGNILYVKRDASIAGDSTKGWIAV